MLCRCCNKWKSLSLTVCDCKLELINGINGIAVITPDHLWMPLDAPDHLWMLLIICGHYVIANYGH
jgi:hypothetical protein